MHSWLDLETRFRNLAPALGHCRLDAQWGAAGEHWRVAGGGLTPAVHEYEILCALGGRMLERVLCTTDGLDKGLLTISDPKVRWFNLLKAQSPFFGDRSYATQLNDDGSSAGNIYTGCLRQPAEAAAVLCLSLHVSHPVVERKSRLQWLHENYGRAIIIGVILAVVGAIIKVLIG